MIVRSFDTINVALAPQVRPASVTAILPTSPDETQIEFPSKQTSSRTCGLKSDPESHGGVNTQLQSNRSARHTRTILGGKANAENLPVPKTKRRKLGDRRDKIVENMEDSADCSRPHSQLVQNGFTAQKTRSRDPRKQPLKNQNSEETTHSRLKGKVIKPSTNSKISTSKKCSMHPADLQQRVAGSSGSEFCGLRLEEATMRRDFWTPIKDTTLAHIDLTGSPVFTRTGETQDKGKDFRSLMSGFNFSREASREVGSDGQYPAEGPTTKQLLELIPQSLPSGKHSGDEAHDAATSSASEGKGWCKPARKPKRPAKSKISTITSLTIGRYESPFTSEGGDYILSADKDVASIQPAGKPSSKRKGTNARSGTKISRDEYQAQARPPIMEALQTIENLALVFGTSSQLERDSSPSVYGLESGLEHGQGQCESARIRSREPSPGLMVSRFSKSKNLWAASSRDLDGCLLNVERVDLVGPAALAHKPRGEQQTTSANRFPEGEIHAGIPPPIEHESFEKIESSLNAIVNIDTPNTIQHPHEISTTHSNGNGVESMPDFNRLSTEDLAVKLASFGFRPIKRREKMIELLEKCWESKRKTSGRPEIEPACPDEPQGTAQGEPLNITATPIEASSIPSINPLIRTIKPKDATPDGIADSSRTNEATSHNLKLSPKAEGNTPRFKGSERDTQPATIEIDDATNEDLPESSKQLSNPENSHIPSRVPSCDRLNGLVPRPGKFSIRTKGVSTKANEPADLPNIFIQITNAVKAQPRIRSIKGVKQPTWHEKIVMYDPIWLDDFTLWLNVEGFKRIHEDREVHASLVREWCESKGICCCFKNKR
ncbi:hypothetical protein H112_02044 [Trichophyton rubrum D6]|uniref:Structure-specific endonuclease subunit SLX4 n=3 Tax=Trichophyton TaxID=5550 RepID=F2SW84_TRIRC|nr:uncharacterized protein TERG_06803 [Trichophyton rubrum CBS 118892]EZF25736.1 hypothetical protein H100_02042 [Trichophyton rubrum MR850]EZF44747.1 hypothetical protein H102_02037 [Trichophyton rubrum CBS 100081]EZF55418.1 hypothetical protein H103_02048 [Trichophyton rubrum CBS 288.86]EZF66036.1 hypothetical protein H104_02024 [Trichophyton rubrum CBS 289.86]EZF76640.1 hypothetical protein H105_02056 [Trichophyton soudanense CBS 452.61]EZF87267.1 hypothetical protein H110_02048 [Trichophy